MAPKKKKKGQIKTKKKRWLPIIAPRLFNNAVLGETHISDAGTVESKTVALNLMTVMNDMRKQGFTIRFDVVKVTEGKALTALTAFKMTPSAVKRLIRRGRNKIDDSFYAMTKDGKVRVKPATITVNKCSKAAQTDIRLSVRKKLTEILKSTTLEDFVREVIDNKLQRVLRTVAEKHHPVRTVEIRAIELQAKPVHKENVVAEATDTPKPAEESKPEDKPKSSKEPKPKKAQSEDASPPKAEKSAPKSKKDEKPTEPKTEKKEPKEKGSDDSQDKPEKKA